MNWNSMNMGEINALICAIRVWYKDSLEHDHDECVQDNDPYLHEILMELLNEKEQREKLGCEKQPE